MSDSKVCLVTGASRGIGLAVARQMRAKGYRVAGTATTKENLVAGSVDLALGCDVSDPAAVVASVDEVLETIGRIDVVVNNAGVGGTNALDSPPGTNDETWHEVFAVNVNGPYYVCKAVMPHLPDGAGRIINVGSVLSLMGVADGSAYTASKHALLGLTRSLSMYLAPRNITVNLVAPGWVDTDMARARWDELGIDKQVADSTSPIGRIMTPDDVATWIGYLASPESGGVTGQVITIDGGSLQY